MKHFDPGTLAGVGVTPVQRQVPLQGEFDFGPARRDVPPASFPPSSRSPSSARQHRGRTAYLAGRAAENGVVRHYQSLGAVVVAKRWRGPAGEIDLILRHAGQLIFVEVKRSKTHERAAEYLRPTQMKRIAQSAEIYSMAQNNGVMPHFRIDVALVDGVGRVKVIENALAGWI